MGLFNYCEETRFKDFMTSPFPQDKLNPLNPMFLNPIEAPQTERPFFESVRTMLGNGSVDGLTGAAIHLYNFKAQSLHSYFCNSDGDLLFIPQDEPLQIDTELGQLLLKPGEIGVVQRGITHRVNKANSDSPTPAKGYLLETYTEDHLRLPPKGLIGTTGLANARDFKSATVFFEDKVSTEAQPLELVQKLNGTFSQALLHRSPFDVQGFMGNYIPYKYNLRDFQSVNTVSYGHIDPSIFTALASKDLYFVVFNGNITWPAVNTFRPPYFHQNIWSEAMGQVDDYEAKQVPPGGLTIHNRMTGHGPDIEILKQGDQCDTQIPTKTPPSIAFMFESNKVWNPAPPATPQSDPSYLEHWAEFEEHSPAQIK